MKKVKTNKIKLFKSLIICLFQLLISALFFPLFAADRIPYPAAANIVSGTTNYLKHGQSISFSGELSANGKYKVRLYGTGGTFESSEFTISGSDVPYTGVFSAPAAGSYNVKLRYKYTWPIGWDDTLWSSTNPNTYYIDATPPSITAITPGSGAIVGSNPTFTWSAMDTGCGLHDTSRYQVIIDGDAPVWTTSASYTPGTLPGGTHTFTLYAKDRDENLSAPQTFNFTVDATPPTGTIAMTGGATKSGTQNIYLNISANDAGKVKEYSGFTEGNFPPNWILISSPLINFSQSGMSCSLSAGDGDKTVSIWYKDMANNVSPKISTTITLDTQSPGEGRAPFAGLKDPTGQYTDSHNVNVNINASDAGTGVSGYMIVETLLTPAYGDSGWISVTPQKSFSQTVPYTLSAGEGPKTIHVWFRDDMNHVSGGSSPANITVDTKAPSGPGSGTSTVSTIASGFAVQDLAADSASNIYVVGGGYLRKISSTGVITIINSSLSASVVGLSIDKNNFLYTSGSMGCPFQKINSSGSIIQTFAGNGSWGYADGPGSSAQFRHPYGSMIDRDGLFLYSSDSWNNRIRKCATDGSSVTTFAGMGIYGETAGHTNQGEFADGDRMSAAKFFSPSDVAIDGNGNFYITDSFNHRIRKIDASGYVSTLAGNGTAGTHDDPIGSSATFYYPWTIAADDSGYVYVSGASFDKKIRKITPGGEVTTYAGTGSSGADDGLSSSATFGNISGLTVDNAGNVYAADTGNNSVRKISPGIMPSVLLLNNGAKLTTVRNIKAKILATDIYGGVTGSGVMQYCLKLSAATPSTPALSDPDWKNMPTGFVNSSPTTQEVDFTFDAAEPDGLKTFYLWFRDKAGNISTIVSKSIKLDTHPPVEPIAGSIGIVGTPPFTSSRNISLELHAESGADSITLELYDIKITHYFLQERDQSEPPAADPFPPGVNDINWTAIAAPVTPYSDVVPYVIKPGDEGTKEIFVWYKDVAGNMSTCSKCSIYFDDGVPNGSIKINGGAEWSNSPAVKLTLKGIDSTGIAACYVSSDPLTPGVNATGWQSVSPPQTVYNAEIPFGLGAANGSKTVYAWYKNTLSSLSNAVGATIKLDSETPAGAGTWSVVGTAGFSAGDVNFTSIQGYNGDIYVAYKDAGNGTKATVMKFNGAGWSNVGSAGFTPTQADWISLCIHNAQPYVVFQNIADYSATIMNFNGSWNQVGLPLDVEWYSSIYSLNGTLYVSYREVYNAGKATVMKFDGSSTWSPLGGKGFSPGQVYNVPLDYYGGNIYCAYTDFTTNKVSCMKNNGSAWSYVGPQDFANGGEFVAMKIINGMPYVAYPDKSNSYKASVMKFTGTAWTAVGDTGGFIGGNHLIDLLVYKNSPCIVFCDSANSGKLSAKIFDGSTWNFIGAPGFSTGSVGYVSSGLSNRELYTAYTDGSVGSKATVMKYESSRSPAFTINNGSKFTSSKSVKYQIACEDNYSGITGYLISEDPTPPFANDPRWIAPTGMGGTALYSFTAEVSLPQLSALGKMITMYCWYKDGAGNISKASTAVINGPTMRAVGSLGDSSQLAGPDKINLCSSDEALLVSDGKNPAAFKYTDFISSSGSRLGATGYAIDRLDLSLSGIIPLSGGHFGVIEPVKKRFSIFDASGNYTGNFTKNINAVENIHGLSSLTDLRAKISDKYSMTNSYVLAETRTGAGQNPGLPVDFNFSAATIEVYSDAMYAIPVTDSVSLSGNPEIYVKVKGAGTDPAVNNSIIMKVASTSDPAGIGVQLTETTSSSDTFAGSFKIGKYTSVDGGRVGTAIGEKLSLKIYSKDNTLFTSLFVDGRWIPIGTPGFTNEEVMYTSLFVNNGTPYLAYRINMASTKATVKKFAGGAWLDAGTPEFTAGSALHTNLFIDGGAIYVAYRDASAGGDKASVMKLDTTSPGWAYVGAQKFSAGANAQNSFFVYKGTPYLAFQDAAASYGITVMKFDGTAWSTLGGAGFSGANFEFPSLFVDKDIPYIAYRKSAGYNVFVKKFTGGSWVDVGAASPGISSASLYRTISLFVNETGVPYIAYRDKAGTPFSQSYKAVVKKFDGAAWVSVGNVGISDGYADDISLYIYKNIPYIAYMNTTYTGTTVKKFDGTEWVKVGKKGFSDGDAAYLSLFIHKGTPYIAFQDIFNSNKATVMYFGE